MTDKQVTRKEQDAVQQTQPVETEPIYVPNVDISENNEVIRLAADMPGVDQGCVDVSVENNVLTIEGSARLNAPEGYELVGQEYGIGKYRRDFTLSDTVDTAGIKARVSNGVLEVTLPKREEVKTRRIEIEA
jgi:HSP20 family molecular chaperone IbpA